MQIKQLVTGLLLCCCLGTCGRAPKSTPAAIPAPAELAVNFQTPPDEAKPKTWFHAMSSNMSKEGLTRDLESLAEVGIGGLLLFNVSQGIPVGDVVYNSDEHHEMIAHAAAESERLGLTFGVHNCDGWSSSGGPWVKPEESMKMLVYSESIVAGGNGPTEYILPQPTTREGYYEDIAVVAYPSLASELADVDNPPSVLASDPRYDTGLVTDGRIDAEAQLGRKGEPAPWLQFSYATPKTVRSANATFTDRHVTVVLQKSDDGKSFEDVRVLLKVRTGKGEWAVNDHFPPVTARHFRLQFNQQVNLREARLTSTYLIDNPLGRTAMARTEDADLGNIGTPPAGMTIDPETVVDLTANLAATGVVTHDLPLGNWTILRFGQTSTGAFNNPASNEGRGLEVDKMSRPAFKTHYDAFIRRVVDQAGAVAPNALQYVEIDSYEAGGQNWTTGFDSIFMARKGYNLKRFLPLMAGRFMETSSSAEAGDSPDSSAERPSTTNHSADESAPTSRLGRRVSAAVLYDFREVVTDLVTENYFRYFTELCHADGLKTYVEPYGFGPLNDLDVGGTCDLPMGEFWMNREMTMVESAVSAAHIYGKPVVSAESFTSQPQINWRGNPAMAKVSGDKAWARGINEFMFHRFAHQANPHVKPGMTMNRWGFHFDRTQTWWDNAGKDWFRYIARGSYLLRQGYPVADLMIFVGDGKPNSRFKWEDFDPAIPTWLNYDNVNADVLINRAGLADGAITLPEGGRYPLLALKNCDHLSLPTLRRLVEIAESGVTVIGEAPTMLAGYGHSEADYAEFTRLAEQLAGKLQPLTDWAKFTTEAGLYPDLHIRGQDTLVYEHRRVGETDIYFFVNTNPGELDFELDFRISGKQPEHWDPMTGETLNIARFATSGNRTLVGLTLAAEESAFIVFRNKALPGPNIGPDWIPGPALVDFQKMPDGTIHLLTRRKGRYTLPLTNGNQPRIEVLSVPHPRIIEGDWQVTFRAEDGFAGTVDFPSLTDWKDHPNQYIRYYSGTATYRTSFTFERTDDVAYRLDLGEVDNVAEVILNGKNLGVQWMKPFHLDIKDVLRTGENLLEIEVTNLWSNRLIGDERYPKQDGGYQMTSRALDKNMPRWYVENQPLPPGPRRTFTTADFYEADDELVPSGLKGPVRIVALREISF